MKAHFITSLWISCNQRLGGLRLVLFLGFLLVANATVASSSFVQQIQSQRLFSPPLEWTGSLEPDNTEFLTLTRDIGQFKTNGTQAGFNGLESFLQQYPQSGWAPAININLAEHYRKHGRYSLALTHWEQAWNATKNSKEDAGQELAVRTVAGWTRLLASLGEKDRLNVLFKQLDDRQLPFGRFGTEIEETKEGLVVMNFQPGASYRCGSFALGHMAEALHLDAQLSRKLYETESPDGGFHMDQLLALAQTNGIAVAAVRRPGEAELVVPSVVHWKLNHYAAITEKKGNLYRVEDPTFEGHVWMDAETINAEASGEFILPKDKIPTTWLKLTAAECANIYGKGTPNYFIDGDDDGPPDKCPQDGDNDSDDSDDDPPSSNDGASDGGTPTPSACPDCGMPQWSISEPYMTLWLKDTPLLYRQSNGKWKKLTLSYKSRGMATGPDIEGFGTDWSCNWLGMLQSDATDVVSNYLAGGGVTGFDTNGTIDYKTARTLLFTGASCSGDGGNEMAVQTPTRAQNIYGVSMNAGYDNLTNFFLSQRVDRYGRMLQRTDFETGGGLGIFYDVVDMDGQTNIFNAGSWTFGSTFVTGVTNPYGFSASFKYQLKTSEVLLTNIVDAQGMSTYLKYNSFDQITNMITLYGTNSFQYYYASNTATGVERAVLITEPTGDHQLYVYRDNSIPTTDGMPYPGDGDSDKYWRLSFHWNRSQYIALGTDWQTLGFGMPSTDYQKASMKHWLHKFLGAANSVTDTLDSSADPYDPILGIRPNCLTYQYYGESAPYIGTLKRATAVSFNGQLALTIGRNSLGRATNFVYGSTYSTLAAYTNIFDPSGEILKSERGPRGEVTHGYRYDPVITNLLVSATNAAGDVTSYVHDPTTLKVTGINFPGGMVRTNVYYGIGPNQGFLAMQADIGFRTNYFGYTNGNLCSQTNELGLVTTYGYDNLNRLTSTAYPDGTTISNI